MIAQLTLPITREALFTKLYEEAFPSTASFVKKMGGSLDDAKDIFHDALVIYYEKKISGNFYPEHSDNAYLTGISKHLWYKKFKDDHRHTALSDSLILNDVEAEPAVSPAILNYIRLSGKKCLELLTSFYYDKLNMKEIAGRFGFAGERSATAQKYKCLEKVRNVMRERSLTKEDFYE